MHARCIATEGRARMLERTLVAAVEVIDTLQLQSEQGGAASAGLRGRVNRLVAAVQGGPSAEHLRLCSQLAAALTREYSVAVPVAALLLHPPLEDLCAHLHGKATLLESMDWDAEATLEEVTLNALDARAHDGHEATADGAVLLTDQPVRARGERAR